MPLSGDTVTVRELAALVRSSCSDNPIVPQDAPSRT